jgi:hypothetical protein
MERSEASVERHWGWVAGAACAVLLWRAAAYVSPGSFITIPAGLHLPHALLGALFFVAGVWAWSRRTNQWTGIFLLYGTALAIHWGGAIGVPGAPSLEMGLFLVYLAITAAGDAAILQLALIYPHWRSVPLKWRVAMYSPAAVSLILAPVSALLPQAALQPVVGIVLLVSNLMSLSAGVLFIVRLFTAGGAIRRAAHLPLIVAGFLSGSVIALLGAAKVLPGVPEAWNLALALIPITLSIALIRQSLERQPPRAR